MIKLILFGCIEMAETVEDKFYFLKKLIMDIVNEVTPLKSVRLKNSSLPWFGQELISLFRKRDKLYESATSFYDKTHQTWKSFVEFRNFCKSQQRLKMIDFFLKKKLLQILNLPKIFGNFIA